MALKAFRRSSFQGAAFKPAVRKDNRLRSIVAANSVARVVFRALLRNSALLGGLQRWKIALLLHSLFPRNATKVRVRNRCTLTGKGRGMASTYRLSRIAATTIANKGLLAGVSKSNHKSPYPHFRAP